MRQITIKTKGCDECPIKTLDMHTLRWKCGLTLKDIERDVLHNTFNTYCPMKEVENENT